MLGAISLDLFAVLLGGAVALMPVYARDILAVGPWGLGLLRAAPAFGAIPMALFLAAHPIRDHAGAIMFAFVALFGAFTIVFGLSALPWLSIVALALMGASDMISVYVRETLMQLWTPDDVRGRVNAVNQVFVGASNELGEFRAGGMAALIGAVPAVVDRRRGDDGRWPRSGLRCSRTSRRPSAWPAEAEDGAAPAAPVPERRANERTLGEVGLEFVEAPARRLHDDVDMLFLDDQRRADRQRIADRAKDHAVLLDEAEGTRGEHSRRLCGQFFSLSVTSSIAAIRPTPRASPTSRWSRERVQAAPGIRVRGRRHARRDPAPR